MLSCFTCQGYLLYHFHISCLNLVREVALSLHTVLVFAING